MHRPFDGQYLPRLSFLNEASRKRQKQFLALKGEHGLRLGKRPQAIRVALQCSGNELCSLPIANADTLLKLRLPVSLRLARVHTQTVKQESLVRVCNLSGQSSVQPCTLLMSDTPSL